MFKQRKSYHSPHTHPADSSERKQNNISMKNNSFIFFCFSLLSSGENNLCCVGGGFLLLILWAAGALETKTLDGRRALNYCRRLSRPAKYFPGFHSETKYFFSQILPILSGWPVYRATVVVVVVCCWLLCVVSLSASTYSPVRPNSGLEVWVATRPGQLGGLQSSSLSTVDTTRVGATLLDWTGLDCLPAPVNHRITRQGDNWITLLSPPHLLQTWDISVSWRARWWRGVGGGGVVPVTRPQ